MLFVYMLTCLSITPSVYLSVTHLEAIVGPAPELHLAVLVIKREPGDVNLTRGLEDPLSILNHSAAFMLYSRLWQLYRIPSRNVSPYRYITHIASHMADHTYTIHYS